MSGQSHFRGLARRSVSLTGTLAGPGGQWERPVRLVDLGLGGARIETEQALSVGAAVRVSVDAPNRWDPLELEAKVAWARSSATGSEAGLAFEHSTRATLRGVLELLSGGGYD